MEIYIIRHGPAGKSIEDPALDEARPLTAKGKAKMRDVSRGLKNLGISFDKVYTSPLARAKETAEYMEKCCTGGIETTDLLKPGSSKDELISFINRADGAEHIALVGHEPFLGEFAAYCLSKSKWSYFDFKKGGVMMLESDGPVKPGKCKLAWLVEPFQLVMLA
jgi:phosphohistidine phosphatase